MIDVDFTSWDTSNDPITASWVYGVASTGIFYKPSALPTQYGVNKIPTGWTVYNK